MSEDHIKNGLNPLKYCSPVCKKPVGGLLLRLILMLALAWLPMGGLMASVSAVSGVVHTMEEGVGAQHQHQQLSPQIVDRINLASVDTVAESCAGHLAPCCSTCISFYTPPALVLMPPSLFVAERYQHYSVPISIVVLARDIRPPIV
jgi:hypothetical protein